MFALLRALSLDEMMAPPPREEQPPSPPITSSDECNKSNNQQQSKETPRSNTSNTTSPMPSPIPMPTPEQSSISTQQPRTPVRSRTRVAEPIFKKGDCVVQTKTNGQVRQGKIVSVHTDDLANGIYYTVTSESDRAGSEFQTDEKLLTHVGSSEVKAEVAPDDTNEIVSQQLRQQQQHQLQSQQHAEDKVQQQRHEKNEHQAQNHEQQEHEGELQQQQQQHMNEEELQQRQQQQQDNGNEEQQQEKEEELLEQQQIQQPEEVHTSPANMDISTSRVTNVNNTTKTTKPMKISLNDPDLAAHVVKHNQTFVFDCDGVLWHGDHTIPGATELLRQLCNLNKRVVFVTNNSSRHRSVLRQRLLNLGVPAAALDADGAVINSGWACARHITLQLPHVRRVFVVGMKGLHQEFEEAGFDVIADGPVPGSSESGGDEIFEDVLARVGDGRGSGTDSTYQHIDAVVVGLDSTVDYRKLCVASVLIQTGSEFLCTNGDEFMMQGGRRRPGNGAVVAVIQTTTGVQPTVTGKPSLALAGVISALPGVEVGTTCMVGDRLDTDMLFGRQAGWNCLAVLSGCSTPAMLECVTEDSPECPHFVARSVADLVAKVVENTSGIQPENILIEEQEVYRNVDVDMSDSDTDSDSDIVNKSGVVERETRLIERRVSNHEDEEDVGDELWAGRVGDGDVYETDDWR